MTQNLKIEVLTGDISIDGMVVTNLVTKEELSEAIVKKADLGTDGKIPTSQLPAEIVNTAGIVGEVKTELESTIQDAVQEANAYAESYVDDIVSKKADLTSGKVPLEQLPAIDQYPQFGTALSNLSTSILTSVKQRTDQLEKSKADLGEDGKVLREQIPSYEKISGLPEQLEVMSTQTAAVSRDLGEHKLQMFDKIDTLKENIEANVQQLTDRQSHLMRTYATKELGVDAKVGVKPGEYFYVRSANEGEMSVEYQNVGGVPTLSGKSYPSSVAVQEIADYTALPFSDSKSYKLNERVQLENGDIVKSTIPNNIINPNISMSGWILSNSDGQIKTWSGRTQEQHNKERPSPADFGANGDGVKNDSQAFIDLEVLYQGRIIDLLGKTYLVTKAFKANRYINGNFKIDGDMVPAVGEQRFIRTPVAPHNCMPLIDANDSTATPFLKLQQTRFNRYAVQSLIVDDINRKVYTMQETLSRTITICQHAMDCGDHSVVEKGQNSTTLFAHSGLGIDHLDNKQVSLWTGGRAVGEDHSNSVKAYRWKPSLLPYTNDLYTTVDDSFVRQEFTLFDVPPAYENMLITTSYDQKWLIALNRHAAEYSYLFRFWDLQMLVDGGSGDYREKYAFDIVTPNGNVLGEKPGYSKPQGTACDGQFFYTVGGGAYAGNPSDPATVMNVWDMQGNLVGYNLDVDVAEQAMIDEAGVNDHTIREIEGMCFAKINGRISPIIYFAGARNSDVGDGEDSVTRAQWLMALGHAAPMYNNTQRLNKPAYISATDAQSLDYAASRNYRNSAGSLKLGTINKNGDQYKLLDLANEGSTINRIGSGAVLSYAMSAVVKGWTYVGANNMSTIVNTGINYNIATKDRDLWRFMNTGELRPGENATQSIGRGEYVVNNIYLQNSPIITSDERFKQQFRTISDREKLAALEIKANICMFKFNDAVDLKGDGARWHVGVKAQQVISIMQSHDLDPIKYGFICLDEWEAQEEIVETWEDKFAEHDIYNENGEYDGSALLGELVYKKGELIREGGSEIIQPARAAGSKYAVRYDELAMFILIAI